MQVIERASQFWKEQPELLGRAKLVGGDFFKPETMPPAQDGDVFLLRTVIHDCKFPPLEHTTLRSMRTHGSIIARPGL